eukprot:GFYU01001658.1.p1 GENE.GFYU01001658.1~~GFYU01001658.1.p1  ORF type:complete len:277 (-),score=86.23 GFYU01001658.1:334-1116(-)
MDSTENPPAEPTIQNENPAEGGGSSDESEEGKRPRGEKKAGRRKINIEFIDDKIRRHITFSKRKAGIVKKAYELSTLTGAQVLLLVASERGQVYTFATPKLQPLITKPEAKALIEACLNSADPANAASQSGGQAAPQQAQQMPQQQPPQMAQAPVNQHMMQQAMMGQQPGHGVPPGIQDSYPPNLAHMQKSNPGDFRPPTSFPPTSTISSHMYPMAANLNMAQQQYPMGQYAGMPQGYPMQPQQPQASAQQQTRPPMFQQ